MVPMVDLMIRPIASYDQICNAVCFVLVPVDKDLPIFIAGPSNHGSGFGSSGDISPFSGIDTPIQAPRLRVITENLAGSLGR